MENIVSLAKRRGFIYPGAEIYSGLAGTWDFGPFGVLMKNNIKAEWLKSMIQLRDDVVGLDSAILTSKKVLEASGHVAGFRDPMVDCKKCKKRFRPDHLPKGAVKCQECGGELTEPRMFDVMFKTHAGPIEDDANRVYLRPETAQGIFVNFANVLKSSRVKIPFGIAQIGKSFRNEITTSNFIFRSREFEQMELEYFVHPSENEKWFKYWAQERYNWFLNLGINKENIKLVEIPKEDIAHYSAATSEVHYRYPFSDEYQELEGIAARTDYDLTNHINASGQDLAYFNEETKERFVPWVIEPSCGVERAFLAFLSDAYNEEEVEGEKRVVLKLHPKIAPIKVAVFPLVKNKESLVNKAKEIYGALKQNFMVFYDEAGAIGRRYRRQDEIGTPWCVTIDFDTIDDNAVTVRDRDTLKQERIAIDKLQEYFAEKLR
ncbi:MAG: glycine--tRNA ligase [Patescibacteria group bacterium]